MESKWDVIKAMQEAVVSLQNRVGSAAVVKSEHSKGPWKIKYHSGMSLQNGIVKTTILAGDGALKIEQHLAGRTFPETSANAALIAKAPEMFELLQLVSAIDSAESAFECINKSRRLLETIDGAHEWWHR